MKNTTAVIFPDTVPAGEVLTPLVPVFEPVVYCQPVENDDAGEPLGQLCSSFIERSFCTVHIPAPLNEHRDRFMRLVKDLRNRRDDYAAQLSYVSLAGMSSANRSGEDAGSSIIGNLLAKNGIADENPEMVEKLLWQARLVLKLGEQHDSDLRGMTNEMGKIQALEEELFGEMVHEDEKPFALTSKLSSLAPDTERMLKLRRKAWARLFAFGSSPVSGSIFITPDADAADLLFEQFERQNGSFPDLVAHLPLPARPEGGKYADRVERFKSNYSNLLQSVGREVVQSFHLSGELLEQWSAALETTFPVAGFGRSQLILYRFGGVRVKQLFLDSFGHDEDELETTLKQEAPGDVIIGTFVKQDMSR